jgi:hypothetical protein
VIFLTRAECVHVGQERRVRLYLLSDPGRGLLLPLDRRAALHREIVRHVVQRVLIFDARWKRLVDEGLWWNCSRRHSTLEIREMPIERPVLRAALIKAEAWPVLSGGMPS